MEVGDLVKIASDKDLGIIVYRHPTKGVVQVYWHSTGFNWESCARLEIISSCAQREEYLDQKLHAHAL